MVVKENKPKTDERTREQIKQDLLNELSQQPEAVLTLAYMYAKGYELSGEDVTRRWNNTIIQNDALNRAYRKGFEDALQYIKDNGG